MTPQEHLDRYGFYSRADGLDIETVCGEAYIKYYYNRLQTYYYYNQVTHTWTLNYQDEGVELTVQEAIEVLNTLKAPEDSDLKGITLKPPKQLSHTIKPTTYTRDDGVYLVVDETG